MNNFEYGQNLLIDSDFDTDDSTEVGLLSDNVYVGGNYGSYGNINDENGRKPVSTIRFQVVIWNIGKLDIVTGTIPMTFRVNLFWNEKKHNKPRSRNSRILSRKSYEMYGRNRAVGRILRGDSLDGTEDDEDVVDVPPLSILNVSTFTTIGNPEVELIQTETRLMRWTCMYRAVIVQDTLSVSKFPHDSHEIRLKLAILSHRRRGQKWDRSIWKLDLATAEDAKFSTRTVPKVPHGLLVDNAKIPGFAFDSHAPLKFRFISQMDGTFDRGRFSITPENCDEFLQISFKVIRSSGYYDNNIVPLLALLNLVAAAIVFVLPAENFFNRSLLLLNIAFNEIGIRMTVDQHLPSVGYQIHLQRILNQFFFVLLGLILESSLVSVLSDYKLIHRFCISVTVGYWIDAVAAIAALAHNVRTISAYYHNERTARKQFQDNCNVHDSFSLGLRSNFVFRV